MYTYIGVYVFMCKYVHTSVDTRPQPLVSFLRIIFTFYFYFFLPRYFWFGIYWVRGLSRHQVPEIHLYLPLQNWDCESSIHHHRCPFFKVISEASILGPNDCIENILQSELSFQYNATLSNITVLFGVWLLWRDTMTSATLIEENI